MGPHQIGGPFLTDGQSNCQRLRWLENTSITGDSRHSSQTASLDPWTISLSVCAADNPSESDAGKNEISASQSQPAANPSISTVPKLHSALCIRHSRSEILVCSYTRPPRGFIRLWSLCSSKFRRLGFLGPHPAISSMQHCETCSPLWR
jgi:hypothetical protein